MPRNNCDLTSRPIHQSRGGDEDYPECGAGMAPDSPATRAHWLIRWVCPTKVSLRGADSARSEVQLTRFLQ